MTRFQAGRYDTGLTTDDIEDEGQDGGPGHDLIIVKEGIFTFDVSIGPSQWVPFMAQ